MTNDEIERISQRVAKLVIENMPDMKIEIVQKLPRGCVKVLQSSKRIVIAPI